MPLSASKRELLTQKIIFNHEILTHRVVARSFKVQASQARALLREFHESSDGRTHATFIVTGYVKPDEPIPLDGELPPSFIPANGVSSSAETNPSSQQPAQAPVQPTSEADADMDGTAGPSQPVKYVTELKIHDHEEQEEIHCVALIPEDEMEERLSRFSRVLSSEVYSLEASKLPDLVLLTDANSRILSEPELAQVDGSVIGTIAHYREKPKRAGKTSKTGKASTSTSDTKISQPDLKRKASSTVDLKTASTSKATTASSSKAGSPAAGDAKKSKGALGSMFAKGEEKNKATAAAAAKEKKEKDDAKAAASSGKGKKKQEEEEKMDVDPEGEDEYADLMMDDDDMMAEIDGLDNGKVSTGQKGKNAAGSSAGPSAATSGKSKTRTTGGRKTRRVTKTVYTKNDKGYRVATQVETDEEYSGSDGEDEGTKEVAASTSASGSKLKRTDSSTSQKQEKESKKKETPKESAAPAAASAASKKTAASGKGGAKPGDQSSLKNFFGKPKASSSKK